MSGLHPVRAGYLVRFLESLGFVQRRQRGSHKFFRHPDGRPAIVPEHRGEDLGRGILAKILHDAAATPDEFLKWLS